MLELFFTFFKLGLFTFGGGYAMIPLIKETIVTKKNWMSEDEVLEMIAISESTPGPIAINMATFIGFKRRGVLGSLLATIGVVLPSLCIIYAISLFYDIFAYSNIYISYIFLGVKCGVAILILKTGIDMLLKLKKSAINITLFLICFICMIFIDILAINVSAILLILFGGAVGIMMYCINKNKPTLSTLTENYNSIEDIEAVEDGSDISILTPDSESEEGVDSDIIIDFAPTNTTNIDTIVPIKKKKSTAINNSKKSTKDNDSKATTKKTNPTKKTKSKNTTQKAPTSTRENKSKKVGDS